MRYFVMVGAVIGALCLVGSFFVSGAPKQAALAAIACAFAVIPYVGWRVSQITDAENEQRIFRQMVIDTMDEMKPNRPN